MPMRPFFGIDLALLAGGKKEIPDDGTPAEGGNKSAIWGQKVNARGERVILEQREQKSNSKTYLFEFQELGGNALVRGVLVFCRRGEGIVTNSVTR